MTRESRCCAALLERVRAILEWQHLEVPQAASLEALGLDPLPP
jgi:hypothetical protein